MLNCLQFEQYPPQLRLQPQVSPGAARPESTFSGVALSVRLQLKAPAFHKPTFIELDILRAIMDQDGPTVSILLVGDPGCGKSTFLAKLSMGMSRITSPISPSNPLPTLRDFDQPFIYNIRMYNRPYRFEFYDTASPDNYTLLKPDIILMCYDITSRASLMNVDEVWSKQVALTWLAYKESIPVCLLGLKRDLRREEPGVLYPQEAHKIAQGLRCDMYCECSAMTGELMEEVFEDIARRAARTTTENGALSEQQCTIM